MIACPKCARKDTVHKASVSEKKELKDLLGEFSIVEDAAAYSSYNLLLCSKCGWFETYNAFPTWDEWYEKVRLRLLEIHKKDIEERARLRRVEERKKIASLAKISNGQ